jgi:hypothetical protein
MMNCVMDYDEVENSPTIKNILPKKRKIFNETNEHGIINFNTGTVKLKQTLPYISDRLEHNSLLDK